MILEAGAHVTPNVRLRRHLGDGGMGAVWVADHLALGTEVAVKFLQGDYATDPSARARFSQEAAAASQVKSSHVVKIYDYGLTDSQVPFIVMELLEGIELSKRMEADRRVEPAVMVAIIKQLCRALERAHASGVIHRDIKPENIFLTNEGGDLFVKLLDFGIAKADRLANSTGSARKSTMAGVTLGTPYYMSPEQFRSSKEIDSRSDLWSVGVVVFEALTGELPFVADTHGALAIVIHDGVALAPTQVNPALPKSIDDWFAKACAHDPANRFQTARELADALSVALGEAPARAATDSITSAPRIVVSHVDIHEANDDALSMRQTAFATSGGPSAAGVTAPKRKVVLGLVGVALVVAIGTTAVLWPSRAPVQAAGLVGPAKVSADPSTSPAPSALPSAAAAPPSAAVVALPSAEHSVAKPTAATAVPGSSASAKGSHERDIW